MFFLPGVSAMRAIADQDAEGEGRQKRKLNPAMGIVIAHNLLTEGEKPDKHRQSKTSHDAKTLPSGPEDSAAVANKSIMPCL